jgi:hypothetical protein
MFDYYQLFRKVYDKTLSSKQANLLIKSIDLVYKDIGLNDFYCSLEVENMSLKIRKNLVFNIKAMVKIQKKKLIKQKMI